MNYNIKKCIEVLANAGIEKTDQNLRYAISTGKLKCTKEGRDIQISDIELEKYISSLSGVNSDIMYFDTDHEKIKYHKELLFKVLDDIKAFNASFSNLSFELKDDYILRHIKSISQAQSNAAFAQYVKALHSDINIQDAENNPLTKQIKDSGRIANLAAISTLPEFTQNQLVLLDRAIKNYRNSVNHQCRIEGQWLVLVGRHYQVDNILLDHFLKDAYSVVVKGDRNKQCFFEYQRMLDSITHFVNALDKLGIQRPDALIHHGQYPIEKLIALGTHANEATARSAHFLNLIQSGTVPKTTESNSHKVHPSEIKANPNPTPQQAFKPSFKILDVPTK